MRSLGLPRDAEKDLGWISSPDNNDEDDEDYDYALDREVSFILGKIRLSICPLNRVATDHDSLAEISTKKRARQLGKKPFYAISIAYQFELLDDSSDSDEPMEIFGEDEDLEEEI